ncbi:hypothetical protein HDU97_000442 [Phlyctochytrium planicorne]|nr:hypothetical protein HDU97_000442 [Phlyctochytrium planicorne]
MEVHPFLAYYHDPRISLSLPAKSREVEEDPDRFLPVADLELEKVAFNKDEVSSVFALPLQELLDPRKRIMMQFRSIEGFEVPSWKGPNGESIWGLTAYILNDLLKKVISPHQPK